MSKNSTGNDIMFMLILSFVCAVLLGGTRAAIGERAELSERTVAAVYEIMKKSEISETGELTDVVEHAAYSEDKEKDKKSKSGNCDDEYKRFVKEFQPVQKGRIKYWRNVSDSALIACEAMGSGMWDEITIVFIYDSSKNIIKGLRVTEQKETAGLGSKIVEEDFYSQFTGSLLNIAESDKKDDNPFIKVDAITSATTSSKAVEKLLERALRGMP